MNALIEQLGGGVTEARKPKSKWDREDADGSGDLTEGRGEVVTVTISSHRSQPRYGLQWSSRGSTGGSRYAKASDLRNGIINQLMLSGVGETIPAKLSIAITQLKTGEKTSWLLRGTTVYATPNRRHLDLEGARGWTEDADDLDEAADHHRWGREEQPVAEWRKRASKGRKSSIGKLLTIASSPYVHGEPQFHRITWAQGGGLYAYDLWREKGGKHERLTSKPVSNTRDVTALRKKALGEASAPNPLTALLEANRSGRLIDAEAKELQAAKPCFGARSRKEQKALRRQYASIKPFDDESAADEFGERKRAWLAARKRRVEAAIKRFGLKPGTVTVTVTNLQTMAWQIRIMTTSDRDHDERMSYLLPALFKGSGTRDPMGVRGKYFWNMSGV